MAHYTIAEAGDFGELWSDYLTPEQYEDFKFFLAQNPEDGDVIKGSKGLRKTRWNISGKGKSGGVRVIYTLHEIRDGKIWLITIFTKSKDANLKTSTLTKLAEGSGKK